MNPRFLLAWFFVIFFCVAQILGSDSVHSEIQESNNKAEPSEMSRAKRQWGCGGCDCGGCCGTPAPNATYPPCDCGCCGCGWGK